MPRSRKTFFIKCGLIHSESKYIFSCYAIKLNTKNTTALQDKSTSTASTIYLVYIHCLGVSRLHLLFHLILGSVKYLKHGQPFHPNHSKMRCPMMDFVLLLSVLLLHLCWRSFKVCNNILSEATTPVWRSSRIQGSILQTWDTTALRVMCWDETLHLCLDNALI